MKRSVVETVLGAVVILVAGFFLVFSYKTGNAKKIVGYDVIAEFAGVGGLSVGDDVTVSGVKVGSVSAVELDPQTYLAEVHMSISPSVKLPVDTAALISSQSLLGGRYLQLEPGADDEMLKPGGKIQYTQAPQNLEELLGKFIFSMQDKGKSGADKGTDKSKDKDSTGANGSSSGQNLVAPVNPAAGKMSAAGDSSAHP